MLIMGTTETRQIDRLVEEIIETMTEAPSGTEYVAFEERHQAKQRVGKMSQLLFLMIFNFNLLKKAKI